jgi:spore maturation protein SpmB
MAQIIKHRRGSLESLSTVTGSLQKGEIVIASGSSNLTASNGNAITFVVPADGTVQATNRIIRGTAAPNVFPASIYNGMLNGVPYYASSSTVLPTLYLLGGGANEAIDLVGNIQPFSASVATSINALSSSIGSGTIGTSVTALNTFSGSVLTQLSTLGTYTASLETKNSALATITGSLISTASANTISITNLNTFSASENSKASTLATYTGSVDTKFSTLGTYTASLETKNSALATITGSLISSASAAAIADANQNTFSASFNTAFGLSGANVTVKGNLTVQGTTTQVDSTTIQLGDNIIELNGTGAANGGLLVKDPTAPNTVSGSLLWDSTNDYWKGGAAGAESKFLRAGGDSVVSGSSQITLQSTTGFSAYDTSLATITGSLITSASADRVSITNLNTFSASALTRFTNLESTSASVNTSIASLNSYTSSNTSTTALNSFTASASGRLTSLESATASLQIETSNLETFSASVLSRLTTLGTYTASVDGRFTTIGTVTASYDGRFTTLGTVTASYDGRFTTLGTVTASYDGRFTTLSTVTSSLNTFSASALTRLSNLETTSASVNISVSNINTFTSSANSRITVLEGTGTKQGVGTTNDVTFNSLTTAANVTIGGDLVVQGNTVTLNTATLVVEDKTIQIASGSTTAASANGAGIEVLGASATITYQSTPDAWQFNKPITGSAVTASLNVPSGGGNSKRIAFRDTNDNINFVTAPTTNGDLLQYDGSNFVMSNTIDGGSF